MKNILITGITGQDGLFLTSEIIKNNNVLYNAINNSSLFASEKIIFLYETSDKIFNQIKPYCIVHFGCKNPSYKEVSRGLTEHAEVCEITYNTEEILLTDLLKK